MSVARTQAADGTVTFVAQLSSSDCRSPDITFQLVQTDAAISVAETHRTQEHAPLVTGDLVVQYQGKSAQFGPYSSAQEVRNKLVAAGFAQNLDVLRTGTCWAGHGYIVTFTHTPGDQPLMSVDMAMVSGQNVLGASVDNLQDGGILMAPIPVDYMHLPVSTSGVVVAINEAAALCNNSLCDFQYDSNLIPTATSVTETGTRITTATLQLAGTNLTPVGNVNAVSTAVVKVGATNCVVQSCTDTTLACTLQPVPAGQYDVQVIIAGRGQASGALTFVYTVDLQSATPNVINMYLSYVLKINGTGFDPNITATIVTVGGQNCPVLNSTNTQIFCLFAAMTTPPSSVDVVVQVIIFV